MKALAHSLKRPKSAAASYLPDFTAQGLDDIDFKQLKKLGVRHLFFDLDQTLRRPYTRHLHPEVIALLAKVNALKQFKSLCLVSNNHRNLERFSKPIHARVFQPYRKGWRIIRKPSPVFFEYVLDELKAKPQESVMIGDRLHADVLGGNRAGIYTIYIKRRGAIDYWFDWLLLTRVREKRHFRGALAQLAKRRKAKKWPDIL